jgi:hypothetical protein
MIFLSQFMNTTTCPILMDAKDTVKFSQSPIQSVPGALSLEIKRQGREADQSPPSSTEVKNTWSYTSTPPIPLHGVVLS